MEITFLDQISSVSPIVWYALGIILIVLEVSGLQGVGLIFAGVAAITLGAFIDFHFILVSSTLEAIAFFFLFTIIWAIILWYPIKQLSKNSKLKKFVDLVGTEAIIDTPEGLRKDKIGYVKWSGVRMRAKLDEISISDIVADTETVWVHGQDEGVLIVNTTKPQIKN